MGLNIPEAFVGHRAQRRGSWLRVKEDLGFKMNFLPNDGFGSLHPKVMESCRKCAYCKFTV